MKVVTWNVNGIRSRIFNDKTSAQIGKTKDVVVESGSAMEEILSLNPDIICLQETRCEVSQGNRFKIQGFKSFFNESKGESHRGPNRYSGTCIFYSDKLTPIKIETRISDYEDTEGRIIIMYFEDFIIVTVYAPNSGSNYEKKKTFILAMIDFLKDHDKIIFCGDLNIGHSVHFDKTKVKPSPGIYPHELKFYDDLLKNGFIDTIKNDDIVYTWWDPRTKKIDGIACTRQANKGWRLDYFFTKGINEVSSKVYKSIGERNPLCSDHAPVLLTF